MIPFPLAILSLAQVAHGSATNTTSIHSCPPDDGTTRSIWAILGSCALTLLICVWHTIHFDVPQKEWQASIWWKGLCGIGSFFTPEVLVALAVWERSNARDRVIAFRGKGYKWSMTHSFFVEMGGFVCRDSEGGLKTVNSLEFLELCEANRLVNPIITVGEIEAMSKSDDLGKAIFAVQLLWFMLQVVVRGSRGLAVTLVELDTLSMAILSLVVIFMWWDKPLCPSPYTLYYSPPGIKIYSQTQSALSEAWKPAEPSRPVRFVAWLTHRWKRSTKNEEEAKFAGITKTQEVGLVSCLATWMILGVLHLVAWNFEFPTETEKILWRIASLVLAAGPLVFLSGSFLIGDSWELGRVTIYIWAFAVILGIVSRALLIVLMLASLRALPCSSHQTVPWTLYIPHL